MMTRKNTAAASPTGKLKGSPVLLVVSPLILLAAFLLLPNTLEDKAHLALHGLCAQRPSHSLAFGDSILPMDARMTGIYTGGFVTLLWIVATRRYRATRTLSRPTLLTLVAFVGVMIVDGANALLLDLGLAPLYAPANELRLATGLLAGTALGVGLAFLFATSVWAHGERMRPIIARPAELALPLLVGAVISALAWSGAPLLYAPLAVWLIVAAATVFWILTLTIVILLSGRGWTITDPAGLVSPGLAGWALALLLIAMLAGMRLAAEAALGLPNMT